MRKSFKKLAKIKNDDLLIWVATMAENLTPRRIFFNSGSNDDVNYIRRRGLEGGEEIRPRHNPLHTVHFDSPGNMARDRENTKIMVEGNIPIPFVNTGPRSGLLTEIHHMMRGSMMDKEMFVGF